VGVSGCLNLICLRDLVKLRCRSVPLSLIQMAAGAIKGMFSSRGLMFTPDQVHKARIEAVQSFYDSNGFVEYSMVKNLGIPQPHAFLQEHCAGGTQLQSVYASHNITAQVQCYALLC
jgi:hypothetical protein